MSSSESSFKPLLPPSFFTAGATKLALLGALGWIIIVMYWFSNEERPSLQWTFRTSRPSTDEYPPEQESLEDLHYRNGSHVDVLRPLVIVAPDQSIRMEILPLGATVQRLFVKDKHGRFRDVVAGYDVPLSYAKESNFPYFGSIVGRYANRIRNATFSIPPRQYVERAPLEQRYFVTPNEKGNTLHGGVVGWSRSGWSILVHDSNNIVLGLHDRGAEGFRGSVYAKVYYTLESNAVWKTSVSVHVFEKSPIMVSSHVYWNLDGFESSQGINTHTLKMDSSKHIQVDNDLIPTGKILDIDHGSPLDFKKGRLLSSIAETSGLCGPGCKGYDTCFIYDQDHSSLEPALELSSQESGIKMQVYTDQPAVQIYSCNGLDGTIKTKSTQPKAVNKHYQQHSCVVVENQGYIDGINHPEWGQRQIFGPARPLYKWYSEHRFSTI